MQIDRLMQTDRLVQIDYLMQNFVLKLVKTIIQKNHVKKEICELTHHFLTNLMKLVLMRSTILN